MMTLGGAAERNCCTSCIYIFTLLLRMSTWGACQLETTPAEASAWLLCICCCCCRLGSPCHHLRSAIYVCVCDKSNVSWTASICMLMYMTRERVICSICCRCSRT